MRDDPLLKSAGFSKNEDLLNFWVKDLREELTIIAVEPRSGRILGLAVNTILKPDSCAKVRETVGK